MPWGPEDWEAWLASVEPSVQRPPVSDDLVHEILLRIPGRQQMTLANLGCNCGPRLAFLAAHFGRVMAIDGSEDSLALAQRSCGASGVTFCRRELTSLEVFSQTFDVVLALGSIRSTRVSELDRILVQVLNSLLEGGVFIATFRAAQRIGGPVRLRLSTDAEELRDLHEVELQYRMRRAGFQGVRVRRLRGADGGPNCLFCMAVRRAQN